MKTLDADILHDDPTLLKLLAEYQAALDEPAEAAARDEKSSASEAEPSGEPDEQERPGIRWVPRVRSLEDVETTELSTAHGRLIAMGWLSFQLDGRSSGLLYRVSAEGRAVLQQAGRGSL